MTRRALTLALFWCLTASGIAQTAEQLFRDGNMLYQQGKLSEARERYEQILALGKVSGELYYNLGNVHYRAGDVARAILFYERALRLMPQDEDLRNNLQIAHLALADRIEPIPRLFLWEWWDEVKGMMSLRNATWLVFVVFTLLCGVTSYFFLARSYRKRRSAMFAGGGLTLLFLLTLTLFFAKRADTTRTDEAILMAPVVTVKNSPDSSSSDAFVLHSGVKVQITDTVGPWVKILLSDGKVGWVERTGLAVI